MNKPFSESCEQNREPILSVIEPVLKTKHHVLEIGSGTGQHAVFFAGKMPHLRWQSSDREENLAGIRCWLEEAGFANLPSPLLLDVAGPWPQLDIDAIFTANTVHIMHRHEVVHLMNGAGRLLPAGGDLLIYGPFNYQGAYTSDSNRRFDDWLKSRDPQSGIKDFEFIHELARDSGLCLQQDHAMPANNRILHFFKTD